MRIIGRKLARSDGRRHIVPLTSKDMACLGKLLTWRITWKSIYEPLRYRLEEKVEP